MLKSNPPSGSIWKWGLWGLNRSWGWSLLNEISAVIKETAGSSLPPPCDHTVRRQLTTNQNSCQTLTLLASYSWISQSPELLVLESLLEAGELGTWTLVADTLRNGQPCEHHCRLLPLWPISLHMCFFVCLFCFCVCVGGFFFFLAVRLAGILVPRPETEPSPSAVKSKSPNY